MTFPFFVFPKLYQRTPQSEPMAAIEEVYSSGALRQTSGST
ncbi:FIG00553955: hypothetical protein [Cronobacter universalis NCTC 9529]|nr:FIG00553955: hypothetical protein [Cronobacter universalis NCTC 9529]